MTNKSPFYWLAIAAGSLTLATAAQAEQSSTADLQTRVLAAVCANCHGTDGRTNSAIPSIAGRPAFVLESRLQAFKRGEDQEATVMNRHASGYSDEELTALAQYFSNLGR